MPQAAQITETIAEFWKRPRAESIFVMAKEQAVRENSGVVTDAILAAAEDLFNRTISKRNV